MLHNRFIWKLQYANEIFVENKKNYLCCCFTSPSSRWLSKGYYSLLAHLLIQLTFHPSISPSTKDRIGAKNFSNWHFSPCQTALFLDASTHLYMRDCLSVRLSVHWSVHRLVRNAFFFLNRGIRDKQHRNHRTTIPVKIGNITHPLTFEKNISKHICPSLWTHLCSNELVPK